MDSVLESKAAYQSEVIIFGFDELRDHLRAVLTVKKQHRKIAEIARLSGVSHSWIHDFINGKEVCMVIMNALANALGVKYVVTNF